MALSMALVAFCTSVWAAPRDALWDFWSAHDPASTVQVDHTPWQAFLERYLHTHTDGINRVAYADAAATGRASLNAYLDRLTALDPRQLSRAAQFAYWVNLYNALTVEVVLRYPDKSSILRMGEKLLARGPWDDELITIAGEPVTLNDIEHRILRPIWQDHRVHFAVNCASLGCPNLLPRAFTPENTETLLEQAEHDYINHPRGLAFSAAGALTVSSIFDWYRDDFAADREGLLAYLASRHATLGARLRAYQGRIRDDYDWQLNAQAN